MFDQVLVSMVTAKYLELVTLSEKRDFTKEENLQYYNCIVLLENEDAVPDVNAEKVRQWREQQDEKTKSTIDHYTNNIIKMELPPRGPFIGEIALVGEPVKLIFDKLKRDTSGIPDIVA